MEHTREHLEAKQIIEQRKEEGFNTALVHITADLLHVGHIDYIKEINRKVREVLGYSHKLMVGVEADILTARRKNKQNIYSDEERKYMMQNIKGVDHAFIYTRELDDSRPYEVSKRLDPDVWVTHEEYAPTLEDEAMMQSKIDSKVVIIRESERQEESMRDKYQRSTTNTIKQILQMYRDNPKYI